MKKSIESFKGFLKPKKLRCKKYQRMIFLDGKIVSLKVKDTESTKCNYKIVKYSSKTKKYFKIVENYRVVLSETRFKLAIQEIIALYPYKTSKSSNETEQVSAFLNKPTLTNIKTFMFLTANSKNVKITINTRNPALWFNINVYLVYVEGIFKISINLAKDNLLMLTGTKVFQYLEEDKKMYFTWVECKGRFYFEEDVKFDSTFSLELLETYKETFKNVLISDAEERNKDIELLAKFLSITTD